MKSKCLTFACYIWTKLPVTKRIIYLRTVCVRLVAILNTFKFYVHVLLEYFYM